MLVTAFVLKESSAHAEANPSVNWSVPAAACTFETGSAPLATVSATWGDVEWANNATGTIRMICPVSGLWTGTDTFSYGQRMDIVFYDTDQTADDCYVKAYLNVNSRSATPGSSTLATYDGTTDTSLNGLFYYSYRNFEYALLTNTWNFDTEFYYIEVEMVRNSTSCSTAFDGVSISSAAG